MINSKLNPTELVSQWYGEHHKNIFNGIYYKNLIIFGIQPNEEFRDYDKLLKDRNDEGLTPENIKENSLFSEEWDIVSPDEQHLKEWEILVNAERINDDWFYKVAFELNGLNNDLKSIYFNDLLDILKNTVASIAQNYFEEDERVSRYFWEVGEAIKEKINKISKSFAPIEPLNNDNIEVEGAYYKLQVSHKVVLLSELEIIELLIQKGISGKPLHQLISHLISSDKDEYLKNIKSIKKALDNPYVKKGEFPKTDAAYNQIKKVLLELKIHENIVLK